jgi:hypothetical protein
MIYTANDNPIDLVATKLLAIAKGLTVTTEFGSYEVVGGRTGEEGPIPQVPWVEIGDSNGTVERQTRNNEVVRPRLYVIFYDRYNGADPEKQKAMLRALFWKMYRTVYQDRTLGGLVDVIFMGNFDFRTVQRNQITYWYAAAEYEFLIDSQGG